MGRARLIAVWVGLAVLLALSFWADAPVQAFVESHRTPESLAVARAVSCFGAWPWLMVASLAAAFAAWRMGRYSAVRFIVVMMVVSSLAGLLADGLRATLGRARPSAPVISGWYGPAHFGDSRYAAFPSGHVAAATGLIAPLLLLRRRMGLVLLALPLLIAAARIGTNAHHFSDTVGGACIGLLIGRGWQRWGNRGVLMVES